MPLGPHLEYLKDPERRMTLNDVRSSGEEFSPNDSKVINIGYNHAGHWVRFRLKNSGTTTLTRYLEFRSLFADHLDLYQRNGRGMYQKMESGRMVPPPERPRLSQNFVFPLTVPPGTDDFYYLYVESADTLTIPLYLHTDKGLQKTELASRSWLAFYQGLIVTMTLFSLFLLVTLRDRLYGYYIGVIVLHQGLFFTLFNGLGYEYFGLESSWWSRQAMSVFVSLSMWMIMQFGRVLLATRQEQPRLDRVIVLIQHAALAITVISLFVDYSVSIRLANPHGAMTATVMWVVGWNSLRKGNPAARYFLIAWSTLIVGGLAYSLKAWGLVPSNLFTEHSWQIGAAIEAIFLSLAIADRINTESRQRIRHQQEAQVAQARALEIQRKANDMLEQRVKERTEELREANRKLQQLSDTDQLTEISNRRALERYLAHTFRRAVIDRKPIAVLMIDVDHFKTVNDTHGHQVGDDCLRVLAGRIQKNSRWPVDMVARYGGEEFCVVLRDTDQVTAMAVAQRIRESVATEPVITRIGPMQLTISVGVYATIPAAEDSPDLFVEQADQALYRSKQEGRNRITLAEATST
ncbi:MAG: sensor domain-containing diguanylate cyclase [Pseudomonadota bacterium]